MPGFFTKQETQSKTRPSGKTLGCSTCTLHKNCTSGKIEPFGNFKKEIMFISDVPTRRDDIKGLLWQGREGRFFEETLKSFGIDLFNDCITVSAVSCYKETEIVLADVQNCRQNVLSTVEKYKPKVIIPLGKFALLSLIGHRWKKDFGEFGKWRGWNIPDNEIKTWICPILHPYYIYEVEEKKEIEKKLWLDDLKNALSFINTHFPIYKEPKIDFIENLSIITDIKQYKSSLMVSPYAAFDYETTGLKPHAEGHRIACAAIANNENHAWAFLMPKNRKERQPFIDFLQNENIRKIAQNMKYEDTWTSVRLRTQIKGWSFDTMLASHILDNRPGITGLKFQVYVQFGIIDYDSDISSYLISTEPKNANSLNKVIELVENIPGGKEQLLTYCGLDAVFEYRLAMLQLPQILPQKPKV